MTGFEYGSALGAIQDANSVPALAQLRVSLHRDYHGDRDLDGLSEMIAVKSRRLVRES